MKIQQIKDTLRLVRENLDARDAVDPELRELLTQLNADIDELLDQRRSDITAVAKLKDRVEAFDADFAGKHPTVERFARELIDALGKMGI